MNPLSADRLQLAKETAIDCLQEMITDINTLVDNGKHLPMDECRLTLIIESEASASFPTYFALDFEFLRAYFQKKFTGERFHRFRSTLEDTGLFSFTSSNLLNPQDTLFGTLVSSYFAVATEHVEKDNWHTLFPLQFDESLFERCWQGILPWLEPKPLILRTFYPIFNLSITGDSFEIVLNFKLRFTIPTVEERMKIAKGMRVIPDSFSGISSSINKVNWLQYCTGWLEGAVELPLKDLKILFSPSEKEISSFLDLLPPTYIEEVFALLGYPMVKVYFFMLNDPFSYRFFYLEPPVGGFATSNFGLSQYYPEWMNRPPFPPFKKNELELTEENRFFFQVYPEFRKTLPSDSVEALVITRFFQAIKSKSVTEAILTSVIALEALLTRGTSDASLQFRLNASWLLGTTFEERKFIEFICKILYGLRSQIVHEGSPYGRLVKKANKIGGLLKAKDLAIDLLRLVILRILYVEGQSLKLLSRDKILDAVEIARLGGELKVHKGILFDQLFVDFLQRYREDTPKN